MTVEMISTCRVCVFEGAETKPYWCVEQHTGYVCRCHSCSFRPLVLIRVCLLMCACAVSQCVHVDLSGMRVHYLWDCHAQDSCFKRGSVSFVLSLQSKCFPTARPSRHSQSQPTLGAELSPVRLRRKQWERQRERKKESGRKTERPVGERPWGLFLSLVQCDETGR